MVDIILRTSDFIEVTIPAPTVVPVLEAPVPLIGSSTNVTVLGLVACLQGDELPPVLRVPLVYTAPPFTIPGTGTLSVTLLPPNLTVKTTNGGKPMLLKGGTFPAMFTVETPATQPTPTGPVPDAEIEKPGNARFISSNETVKAG
jgi:hypothetical protein